MITFDTSAIIAATNLRDPDHGLVAGILRQERAPRYVPVAILSEVGYMLETLGLHVLPAFLDDLRSGGYAMDCGEGDIPRIQDLLNRYQNLPLSFSDASVIAYAERHGGHVFSLDEHFHIVAGEGRLSVVPIRVE